MKDRADELADLHEMQLGFDGRNPRQLRRAALIHALDVWDQIELIDLSAKQVDPPHSGLLRGASLARPPVDISTHLQLITQTGEVLTGYKLFRKLTRALPLLRPLALVTWVR